MQYSHRIRHHANTMKSLASLSLFVFRLLITSLVALCCQIFLIVRYPDYLLVVQEAVKKYSTIFFQNLDIGSSYKVAYNLINGDGIVVHTLFVLLAFTAIFILLMPVRLLRSED